MADGVHALPRFVLLYAVMYASFGVSSPFLPAFVSSRGLSAQQVGLVLAAGTSIRLLSAPIAGRVGDRLRNLRAVMIACIAAAALLTLAYVPAHGFWSFLGLNLAQAFALAPITVLADALALGAAAAPAPSGRRSFEYGWVRGSGSAAFIAGTILAGQVIGARGLEAILVLWAALLGAASVAGFAVPELAHARSGARMQAPAGSVRVLLRIPAFRKLVLAAGLILGSHAMHDAFAMIRWQTAGISPATASVLWSESVAAEVLVFYLAGPPLLARLGPAAALALAAVAGVVRWMVMAQTTQLFALALVQPLHGITFALLHLACMQLVARLVPKGFEGTGQALYATLGAGAASALLTLASGPLYATLGAHGFWVMALLCALALPAVRSLARDLRS